MPQVGSRARVIYIENSCFSYSLAVLPSFNAKLLCELLPYHKYNNFG